MGAGVGTQGDLISLSAPDQRSRGGSNPSAPTKFNKDTSMPYVQTEVWVDDPDISDIIDEADDRDLIDELQKRGYTVMGKLYYKDRDLFDLYTTYMTCSSEFFQKELKKYFRETLNVSLY